MILYLDFETRSPIPIRRGSDVYLDAATPLLLAYAVDDGPVVCFDFTTPNAWPIEVRAAIAQATTLIAHNAFFDRNVLTKCLDIQTPLTRWRCTMAQALAHGLPGGLDALCTVLGVPQEKAKIADGRRLVLKFCVKKDFVKDHDWPLFIQYCKNDVEAMRECYKRMPAWNQTAEEIALWHVDQTTNDRGFQVDTKLAEAAVKAIGTNKAKLDRAMFAATCGMVAAATQRDKMINYLLEARGLALGNLRASTVKEALEDETIDESTKALLRLRQESSKNSTAKYKTMLASVGKGGRLRGTLQFAGASRTARWSGRIFQPQNLPRPTMHPDDIRNCIPLALGPTPDLVTLFAPVSEVYSNAIRGLIVAAPGKKLLVADYASIEARVNAWLSGEEWVTKAFREGADLYKLCYAKAFGIPVESVTKQQRQIGKTMFLLFGYGGGVGAFVNLAMTFGLDLDELGQTVESDVTAHINWDRALAEGSTFKLTRKVYVACDTLKILYRRANTAIVRFWHMLEDAARSVINARKPALKEHVGHITLDCSANWLRLKLPSGRFLSYAAPQIDEDGISYMSWVNKKWVRTQTWGGKICENLCQAVARDLLAHALVKAETAGFPVVLHIHDEVIAEVDPEKTLAEFLRIVKTKPAWAAGLPLEAEGFETERYYK